MSLLLKYCQYSKLDRLKFHTHDGPTDIKTMTEVLQLRFKCDADLPSEQEFNDIPALELVADADNADALR